MEVDSYFLLDLASRNSSRGMDFSRNWSVDNDRMLLFYEAWVKVSLKDVYYW